MVFSIYGNIASKVKRLGRKVENTTESGTEKHGLAWWLGAFFPF